MNEELKIIISAEIDKLKKELQNATKETEKFSKKGKEGFQNFNDGVQKAGAASTKILKSVAVSVAALGASLLALGASSEEYRVSQAQLTTTFETAGASAEQAKVVYEDLYRVLGDNGQATEAAQHLAQLTTNQQELSEWTNICQGVYATFGSSLPIESLTEAANETAKTGELTGALADALNWAGISEADFAAKLLECNTEAEREALIRSTLSGLYTEAAAGYEKNAAAVLAQHEAEVKLNEAMAALGEAVAPINTLLAEFAAQMLTQVAPAVQEFANEHGKQIEKVLTDIAEAIGAVIGWIADNWDLISTLAPIVLGIAAAISTFATVMGIVNAVMAASPVTWIVLGIVAAIVALVAIIVVLVKNWDKVKAAAVNCWNAIKNAFVAAGNWINTKVVQPIAKFFSSLWNGLKNGAKGAINGIISIFEKGLNAIIGLINGITGALSGIWTWTGLPAIPKIPKAKLPRLAKGGVVDEATLGIFGEAGKEVVMPLENNTEWIDILANRIAGVLGGGGNRPIVLQVDGKTFAQTAVKSINDLTRQQGKLALNLK